MRRLFSLAAIVISFGLIGVVTPVGAQDEATPSATFGPLGAAQCTVEPIDAASYTEAVMASTPPAVPDRSNAQAASPEVQDAAIATIAESVACTNAGDLGRLLALIDPSYAPTLLGVPDDQIPAAIAAAAERSATLPADNATPLASDYGDVLLTTLVSVENIVSLSNDLVSADVATNVPDLGIFEATVYLYPGENDRYIILMYVYHTAPGNLATPAA